MYHMCCKALFAKIRLAKSWHSSCAKLCNILLSFSAAICGMADFPPLHTRFQGEREQEHFVPRPSAKTLTLDLCCLFLFIVSRLWFCGGIVGSKTGPKLNINNCGYSRTLGLALDKKEPHAAQGIWLLFEAHIKGEKTTEEAERGRKKGGKLFRHNKVTVS